MLAVQLHLMRKDKIWLKVLTCTFLSACGLSTILLLGLGQYIEKIFQISYLYLCLSCNFHIYDRSPMEVIWRLKHIFSCFDFPNGDDISHICH